MLCVDRLNLWVWQHGEVFQGLPASVPPPWQRIQAMSQCLEVSVGSCCPEQLGRERADDCMSASSGVWCCMSHMAHHCTQGGVGSQTCGSPIVRCSRYQGADLKVDACRMRRGKLLHHSNCFLTRRHEQTAIPNLYKMMRKDEGGGREKGAAREETWAEARVGSEHLF